VAATPSAADVAWAPLLLVVLRLGQGLALGALAPARPATVDARRELVRSRLVAGAIALIAAGAILGVFAVALPAEDFLAWGWRYPFVLALALNMVAFFGDLRAGNVAGFARAPVELRLVSVSGVRVG
jgi:MFS family permease